MAATFFNIANPTVLVNGEVVGYVPNSLSKVGGFGDVSVRAEAVGGGVVNNVISRNLTTATGHFKLKIYPRSDMIALFKNAQQNVGNNAVEIADTTGTNIVASMSGMSVTTDITEEYGSDAEIEIEMKGNRWSEIYR